MTSSDPSASSLSAWLVQRYAHLRDRLTRRLGSQDLAGEALHEMWLKLSKGADIGPVSDPDAYLYRAALNTASNLESARRRRLGTVDIEAILELADDAPDPERIVIARHELAALRRALEDLTARQRDIFTESFTGHATHAELAARHGVTVRTIQSELRAALLHCAKRMIRKSFFAQPAVRVSRKR